MISNKVFYTAVTVVLITIIGVVVSSTRGSLKVVATNLENIPMIIGEYQGLEDSFSESIYKELNADKNVYRHYRSEEGKQIDLYIGYYGTAKGGRSTHNPNACLPGAGWSIIKEQAVGLTTDGELSKQVRSLTATRDGRYLTLYHWYQSNRTDVLDSGFSQNVARLKNLLLRNRNDGAFVQISIESGKAELADSKLVGLNFARKVNVLLADYWPEESDKG